MEEMEDQFQKIAIIGSRTFNNYTFLREKILQQFNIGRIDEIISGGAIGADSLALKFAKEFDIPFTAIPPDYDSHGKRAPFLRNIEIANYCDTLVAFWDGKSKGTKFTIDEAKSRKKNILIFKTIK